MLSFNLAPLNIVYTYVLSLWMLCTLTVCTVCVHLSVIHSECCFSLHKIFMLVVHAAIIAISSPELFMAGTVLWVSFTDREDNTEQEDCEPYNASYFALSSGIILPQLISGDPLYFPPPFIIFCIYNMLIGAMLLSAVTPVGFYRNQDAAAVI